MKINRKNTIENYFPIIETFELAERHIDEKNEKFHMIGTEKSKNNVVMESKTDNQ